MPGYQLASDGTLNWLNNKTEQPVIELTPTTTPDFTNISGLFACDLKTNVLGKSVKIQTPDGMIFHLPLNTITSFDILFNTVQINTSDEVPFTLTFIDDIDAIKAANNLELAMNGGLINCVDDILTLDYTLESYIAGDTLTYPALIFIDGNLIGRAATEEDFLLKVNELAAPFYYITLSFGSEITLNTYKRYLDKIPKSFQLLSQYFGGVYTSKNFQIEVDYTSTSDFWVYDGDKKIVKNETSPSSNFDNTFTRIFEVYYLDNFLQSLNLSNINLKGIIGTLPSQLQNLIIDSSLLTSISFLSQILELKSLVIKKSPIGIISADLNNLTKLNTLIFENCNFTSLPLTDNLVSLLSFTIKNTPIIEIPVLSNNLQLNNLYFENCPIVTLNVIPPSVKYFSAKGLDITDFVFPSAIALEQLNLSGGQLDTIDLFAVMNLRLIAINLANNKFDISSTTIIDLLGQILTSGAYNGLLDLRLNLGAITSPFLEAVDKLKINRGWVVLY